MSARFRILVVIWSSFPSQWPMSRRNLKSPEQCSCASHDVLFAAQLTTPPNHTAWRQGHVCVKDLPTVVVDSVSFGRPTKDYFSPVVGRRASVYYCQPCMIVLEWKAVLLLVEVTECSHRSDGKFWVGVNLHFDMKGDLNDITNIWLLT